MKQQALIDKILETVRAKIGEEVGGLLGQTLTLAPTKNHYVSKAEFLDAAAGQLAFSKLSVTGDDQQGEIYLFLNLKDAILLGGTLLMVPPAELEKRMRGANLDEETADAFSEIINIIAGIYNAAFEQLYKEKLHFAKIGLETIVPTTMTEDSAQPFPDQELYMAAYDLELEDKKLGKMQIIYPATLFGLGKAEQSPAKADGSADAPPHVLIVADNTEEAGAFTATLQEDGYSATVLDFKDTVKDFLAEKKIQGVFLVMSEVNEQGFGAAIKVRSACDKSTPLVVAGPQWTRKAVLQAVRYGACDVMVTPATPEDIREKIKAHIDKRPTAE